MPVPVSGTLAEPPGVPLTVKVPFFAPAETGANCSTTSQVWPTSREMPWQESLCTKNSPVTAVVSSPDGYHPLLMILTSMAVLSSETDPDATDGGLNATTAVVGSVPQCHLSR